MPEHYSVTLIDSWLKMINDQVTMVLVDSNTEVESLIKVKNILCNCYESLMDLEMEL